MKTNKNVHQWIYSRSKHVLPQFIFIILLSIALATFGVLLALASKSVIDVATGKEMGGLVDKSVHLFLIIIGQIILQAALSNINTRANGYLALTMKKSIFQKLMRSDWQSVTAYHSGDLLNHINSDVGVVVSGVLGIVPSFLSLITRLVASFWYLFSLDSTFAIILLVVGPVVLILARVYSKKMKWFHKKCQENDGKISSFMQESIQNLLMIKSFSSEDYIVDHSTELQQIGYKLKIKRNTISIFANIGLYLTFSSGYYLALAWGAFRLATGMITYGTMTAFLQLINQVQMPFMNLSGLLPQYYSMIASSERLMKLENIPLEIGLNDPEAEEVTYENMESIVIEGLIFSYDAEPIFDDASYRIEKGKFVTLAGTSGAGKSTLVKLMMGIISPKQGGVYFQIKNGEKIRVDLYTRKLFAYVPQGNMILSGSIRDNIKFSTVEADDEKVIEAAKIAMIWDFIEQMPQGLDTEIGERGMGLSEGQVQRLAIARALLYDSPILLLDEATSALDERTERAVLENIKALSSKMCIIISHKKAAMEISDEVITIQKGKIVNIV